MSFKPRNLGKRLVRRLGDFAVGVLCKYAPQRSLHAAFARRGFHLIPRHYHVPIPDEQDLADASLRTPSEMRGVAIDEAKTLALLDEVIGPRAEEFRKRFALQADGDPRKFHLLNGAFMAVDAHVYWALLRHHKPRQVIEVGGGQSTLLAAAALQANADEGRPGKLTVIEPYPNPVLQAGFPGLDELVVQRLQDVPLERFTALGPGDVLFIDSTHVLRPGGDVQRVFCEILPRLGPGVLVHVHDICLPGHYPTVYFDNHWYWNEQYLLQAFLAFNSRFEVVWPGAYLTHHHPERVRAVLPELDAMQKVYPQSDASSFWMQVVQPGSGPCAS